MPNVDQFTDSKGARVMLSSSEVSYRALFESIDEGFCIVELLYDHEGVACDCRYVEVNSAFLQQTGQDDPTGKLGSEYVPASAPMWLATYDTVVRSGEPVRFEQYHPDSDRWYSVYASVIGERGSRLVASVFADVTDRKHGEAALRESERLRRVALSGGRMGTWRWDRKADLIQGDEQFFALWGVPQTDEPLPLTTFAANMSAEGVAKMEQVVARALAANEEFSGPLEVCAGPRKGNWLQWQGGAAEDDPSVLYGVTFDITERRTAEASLQESQERQAFVLKLSDAVRLLANPAAIQGETTRLLREQLNSGWCYYVDWDLEQKTGLVLRDSAREGLPSLAGAHDVSDAPEFLQLLADGQMRVVPDYANYEPLPLRTRQQFIALGFKSMMMAPLVKEGRLIATLLVGDTALREWSASEASLLVDVAERTWAAIERGRTEGALRESQQTLASDLANAELLRSLSERLVPGDGLQSIYDEVLSATVAIARADAGTIQIFDPATQELQLIASVNFSRTITDYYDRVDAGSRSACGVALKTGGRAFVDFPEEVEDFGCQLLVGEGILSAIAVPLISRTGEPHGMLNAHWRHTRHRPTESELRFLDLLARQAADLIEQRRTQNALRESEERQRALIEGVPQLVWRANNPGDWTWASPQWTEFTGQQVEDSRGWGWLSPVHPDDREQARERWYDARKIGRFEADYRIFHVKEQRYRWFQTRATPVHDADGAVTEWLGTSTDVDDLRGMRDRQQVLVAELQHRVRNILTIVRSVFQRTVEADGPLDAMIEHFRGRLDNLARTQVIVTQSAGGQVDLRNLIVDELMGVGVAEGTNIIIDGPDVAMDSQTGETISLAIHELTTNAVKYGALKIENAILTVRWSVKLVYGEERRLDLTWIEQGVPAVPLKPARHGFGSELIEEAIPYQLGGETTLEFRGGGVRCTISVPLPDAPAVDVWEDR